MDFILSMAYLQGNLRSTTRGLLNFPRCNMTSYERRAFSYAGTHCQNICDKSLQSNFSSAL